MTPVTEDMAIELARRSRRVALLAVLRQQRALTLEQLDVLLQGSSYASELRELTVAELLDTNAHTVAVVGPGDGESIEDAIMRVFRRRKFMWLSSSVFVRLLGLQRWTAQQALAELAECGLLERRGTTSATRYRLASASARTSQANG